MSSQDEQQKITVNSILQIDIPSFENKFVNNKSETFYTIEITNLYNNKKWSLEKTYKDIELLHSSLTKFLPQVPSFSSFSLFKSTSSFKESCSIKVKLTSSSFKYCKFRF